jgi:hypothetical protein
LVRPGRQAPVDGAEDGAERAVVDTDDDDQSGMRSVGLGPAAGDVREVGDVEGHHDPVLVRSHFQPRLVRGAVELALLVSGAHVVVSSAQSRGDSTRATDGALDGGRGLGHLGPEGAAAAE